MLSDRLHLENYQVEQISYAILELLKKYGLDESALSMHKWVKLGACLKAGEHDEFNLSRGNEHIRRLDVVGHPSTSMNIVVVYDGADMPDYAKTRELRALINKHSRGTLCKPEEPIDRVTVDIGQTRGYELLDEQPSCVRLDWKVPAGAQWLRLEDEVYAVYLAPAAETGDKPWLRINIFGVRHEQGGQVWYTQTDVVPATYRTFKLIDLFMSAQLPQTA